MSDVRQISRANAPAIEAARLLDMVATTVGRTILPQLTDEAARRAASAILNSVARHFAALGIEAAADHGQPRTSTSVEVLTTGRTRNQLFSAATAAALDRFSADVRDTMAPSGSDLTTWLRKKNPDDAGIGADNVALVSGGNSKQTIAFDIVHGNGERTPVVLRRDRAGSFVATSVADEFGIVRSLFEAGFPVAEPLWLEIASDVIAGRFMVSARVPGRQGGGPMGAYDELEGNPLSMLAQTMAGLHALPPSILGGGAPSPAAVRASLIEAIDYWHDRYTTEASMTFAVVPMARDWLIRNADIGVGPAVIVHGDMGFHNILIQDGQMTAVLDWELSHIGAAAEDICRCREFIERLGSFDDFMDHYVEHGGQRPSDDVLEYFDVFITLRNAEICAIGAGWANAGLSDDICELDVFEGLTYQYADSLERLMIEILSR